MKNNRLILTMAILLGATGCSYMHNGNCLQVAEEATEPNRLKKSIADEERN
jgi:hypothetical protein